MRQGKILLAVVTLFGSCMFESSIITSGILLGGGRLRINEFKFLRDAGICIVGLFVLLAYGVVGKISLYTGSLLPIIYVAYVLLVLYSESRWKDPFVIGATDVLNKPQDGVNPDSLPSSFLEVSEGEPKSSGINGADNEPKYYKSCFKFFLKCVAVPLDLMRKLTIPLYEEKNWNRYYASLTPFFGFPFTLYAIERDL